MILRLICFLCVILLRFSALEAKPPPLTPRDTRVKIEEILKAHVCHQKLTEEIASRSMQNFLEELDPGKTYFLESDITGWINPPTDLLAQTLEGYHREDFSVFESMHE